MKRYKFLILVVVSTFFFTACSDFLELKPLDRVASETLLSDESGINLLLANLYNQMPIEDFSYFPDIQFNYHSGGGNSGLIDRGHSTSFFTDESVNTLGRSNAGISEVGPVNDGFWAYGAIRDVNLFQSDLQNVDISEDVRAQLTSEAHFIKAYLYFGLAKRYGGVPLIKEVQVYDGSSVENLYVPRSTEKETWDYVLSECDEAIKNLPTFRTSFDAYRATRWAALALKSRAALHAASLAKYWDKAPLAGEATTKNLVGGMTQADADNYYAQCIAASKEIIDNSGKSLYKSNPANVEEAINNYQTIFENPTNPEVLGEVIFLKSYIDGSQSQLQGHSTDAFFQPKQTTLGGICGRFSPVLNMVDLYEDYTDDGTGRSVPLQTREDGNETHYIEHPENGIDLSVPYIKYNNVSDIFVGKDARFYASIIMPGSVWKGETIIIQAGLIENDGNQLVYEEGNSVGLDGQTYYSYGAESQDLFSGFKYLGSNLQTLADYSSTGFLLRKFLQEEQQITGGALASTTPYIDFRLAEIYLNYAEAVVESGQGDQGLAKTNLNALRHRAAHTDNIDLTLENVLKERRIELAFEGHRYWDLVRRRDYHLIFDDSPRKSLLPILDLREEEPQYIFVRADNLNDLIGTTTFYPRYYYRPIPGTATNQLVQNPEY